MFRDLKFAVRRLVRQPAFTVVAVVTLALGIGANTAIFSVLNAVLLRELPYRDPGQLYRLRTEKSETMPTGLVAPRFIEPLNEGHSSVEAAAIGFLNQSPVIGKDGTPSLLVRYSVTSRFFEVFNDPMTLGRGFKKGEPGGSIVISEATWRRLFDADPNILGAAIRVENGQRTVIGVAARGFDFPRDADAWSPLNAGGPLLNLINYEGYLRLRPGVSQEQFEAQLPALSSQLGPFGATKQPVRFVLHSLLDDIVGDLRPTVLILSGATGILLLIACLNVVNLLLSRATARGREAAIREALGARRGRILWQLLTEGIVLSTIGGILGMALSYAGVGMLMRIAPTDLPRLDTVSVDRTVLLYSAAIMVLAGLVVGLAPAIRLLRTDLRSLINEGGRGSSGGPDQSRVFGALVVAEIGLAVVLVIGAGLLVRSYQALMSVDPGFNPDRILTFALNVPQSRIDIRYRPDAQGKPEFIGSGYVPVVSFYNELLDRIRRLPGVEGVAASSTLPLSGDSAFNWDPPETVTVIGRPDEGGGASQRAYGRRVTTDFFRTLGVRLVAGRALLPSDQRESLGATVVNEAFVRNFFPSGNPIGKRLKISRDAWRPGGIGFGFGERVVEEIEIVGVAADVRYVSMTEPAEPSFYLTQEQAPFRRMTIMVRTRFEEPGSLVPAIRGEIAAMDPNLPADFTLYSKTVAASVARQRLGMVLLVVFGAVALALAAIGIYGLMAYTVTRRAGEIAVRAALGASAAQVRQIIMRRGLFLGSIGIVLGVLGAVALRRIVASQLYGVSALNPGVFVAVPLTLFAVCLLASYLPARRAAKIPPSVLLRMD